MVVWEEGERQQGGGQWDRERENTHQSLSLRTRSHMGKQQSALLWLPWVWASCCGRETQKQKEIKREREILSVSAASLVTMLIIRNTSITSLNHCYISVFARGKTRFFFPPKCCLICGNFSFKSLPQVQRKQNRLFKQSHLIWVSTKTIKPPS